MRERVVVEIYNSMEEEVKERVGEETCRGKEEEVVRCTGKVEEGNSKGNHQH